MATRIRAELSLRNRYHIDKHRYYELKHLCLQYPLWKDAYASLDDPGVPSVTIGGMSSSNLPGDPTAKRAMLRVYYTEKMGLIERVARDTDPYLYDYILKAVTEGLSYTYLKLKLGIPCGKDMYYDRYRRFFWLLSESRN